MPPSPAMRSSHGREFRGDNHKRGRSLEGGILFGEKDDDLALFNEMQTRERDNFLLKSNDDFEDLFCKFPLMMTVGIWLPSFWKHELKLFVFKYLILTFFFVATKLRYFSDYNLGISIPVRGENSDLLNADGEKHDYDW